MNINYKLTNSDFLEYQLYTSSKSELHKKKRRNSRILIPSIYLLFAIYMIFKERVLLASMIIVFGLLWFLLYPIYSRYRYRKYFEKHIKENYKNRINTPIELHFDSDFINTTDFTAQSKIKYSEMDKLIELQDHFFIKLKSDLSLIIPKQAVTDKEKLKQKMASSNVEYVDELNWRWK